MHRTTPTILIAAACLTMSSPAVADGEAKPPITLSVEVRGISSAQGLLQVGLYLEPTFPEAGQQILGITLPAQPGTLTAVFEDVPPGTYAVAIFHDANGNHALDKNFFGVPNEDYAFSHNARGTFGPPDFAEASFQLDSDTALVIDLN